MSGDRAGAPAVAILSRSLAERLWPGQDALGRRIVAIDPGYRPERVVMATVDLSILGYSEESGRQFFQALLERVSALPAVRSASLGKSSPAVDWSDRITLFRQGEAPAVATRYE